MSAKCPRWCLKLGYRSRDDLVIDAWQWLMCSGGFVRLVVIVDVKEDRRALLARRKSDEVHHRRRSLLESFGNEKARLDNYLIDDDNDEIITQISQDDETVYAEVAASILLDDWVGPVTATLEVWEKGGDGQPRLRDGPTSIDPSEDTPTNPVINITDIVPPEQREATFDESRTAELDLELYRELLNGARVKCAEGKAWKFLRPRSNDS